MCTAQAARICELVQRFHLVKIIYLRIDQRSNLNYDTKVS